jgi:hypothetical protein
MPSRAFGMTALCAADALGTILYRSMNVRRRAERRRQLRMIAVV